MNPEEWDSCECGEVKIPPAAHEVQHEGSPYVHQRARDGECYRDSRRDQVVSLRAFFRSVKK